MTVLGFRFGVAFFAFAAFFERAFAANANLRLAASCFADGVFALRRFLVAFADLVFVVLVFICELPGCVNLPGSTASGCSRLSVWFR